MSAAAAAAPPPFPGALKSARTGRWFKDPAAQDIHRDVWVEEECDQPPVEEFMRFVAAGPFKEAFAELQAAPPLKRQATSDLRQADAEAIGEAAGTVAAAAPGLAAEAEQVAALGGPASYGELDRMCEERPSFRGGKCCAGGDCVRRLWFAQNRDAWGAYRACRPAPKQPAGDAPRAEPSSAAVKSGAAKGFQQTVGGYADDRTQGGGGADSAREERQAQKRRRLEAVVAVEDAQKQRVREKEHHVVALAKARQEAAAGAAAAGEPPPARYLMCVNAALFFVDEAPHWLYAKSGETHRTRCARLGINRVAETGKRADCRDAAGLAQFRCCGGGCCTLIEQVEHQSWIDLWIDAGADASRWSVLKLHTVHHPDMCTAGRLETFGCSEYLIASAEAADRWATERTEHGNTGLIPWNKCPELLTAMVRECLEVYTYTDPSSGVAAGDGLAKRRWSSTSVSCVRDLYEKFLVLWGASWREALERTRRAKEEQQQEHGEQGEDGREEPMSQQQDQRDNGPAAAAAAAAAVCPKEVQKDVSFSSFQRQVEGVNAGDCVCMSKASYEHNKCSECKEDEMAIKEGGMQEKQALRRLALLADTPANARARHELQARAHQHAEAQRTALHRYRRHNSFDYHQRFHFTHIRRVTKALGELREGLDDGQLGPELPVAEFERQLAQAKEPRRAPEMVDAYRDMFEEPALVTAYTPDPCDCSDVMMHRPPTGRGAAKFIGLSRRKEAKDAALAHGKTNGAMRIPPSQTGTLGHWASSKRAQKHWRGDLTAEVRKRTFIADVDEPANRHKVRRLNYITRQPSSVAQWPTEPFRESLARSRNEPPPTNLQPQPDFPESDGEKMSRTFHLPASPNYYAPAVAELDRLFAQPDQECDMQHLVELTCVLNGVPLTSAKLPCVQPTQEEADAQHHKSLGQLAVHELKALCHLHGANVHGTMKGDYVSGLLEKIRTDLQQRRDAQQAGQHRCGDRPAWALSAPRSFAQIIAMYHVDDMSDQNVPSDPNDVPGLLEKIPIHVHGHYDMRTGRMRTTLMEPGAGSKDTDCVLDELLADLIATCGAERPAVIYMTNDCGPLQLNQFQVQMAQFLVDRGFCLFCVLGYHQQLHGKYHCDYKFGNYTIAWTTKATFTIDDLARVVQTLPKCNKNGTNVHPDDKDDCAIMRPNAGTIYRKHLAGIYRPVDSLGQAKNNIHVIVVGHDLKGLSNEAVTVRRTRNNGTSAIVTTSLRLEMTILSAGKRGVARMWTYAPARDAAAMSSYALAKRQACDEGHDVTREQPTASELVQFDR